MSRFQPHQGVRFHKKILFFVEMDTLVRAMSLDAPKTEFSRWRRKIPFEIN